MFKRIMRWLFGPEPKSMTQCCRDYARSQRYVARSNRNRGLVDPHPRYAMTVSQYTTLIDELGDAQRMIVHGEFGGVCLGGVEFFPDPSVTEFTSR